MRHPIVVVMASACAAIAPSAASAATVESTARTDFLGETFELVYSAAPSEVNAVSLDIASTNEIGQLEVGADGVLVREEGSGVPLSTRTCVPLTSAALCTSLLYEDEGTGINGASLGPWQSIVVRAGDGGDAIVTRGLRPGPASWAAVGVQLYGEDGDDRIDAQNDVAEHIFCGPGTDAASVDYFDLTEADCEAVSVRGP